MGISKETLEYELLHAAKLHSKHRGEIAELAFMRKAATLGFAVAKPWGDCERYDVILRAGKTFWRVQIKSVWSTATARPHYRVKTVNCLQLPYRADEIDFLVTYIFAEDTWYVFPVSVVENHQALIISTKSTRSRLEQYREAWELMRAGSVETATPQNPEVAAES